MVMTHDDIVREYRNAANPAKQIQILADENECTCEDIRNIVAADLEMPSEQKPRRKSWGPEKNAEFISLILQQKTAAEIAEHLGITRHSVYVKARMLGLHVPGAPSDKGLHLKAAPPESSVWREIADRFAAATESIVTDEPRGVLLWGAAWAQYKDAVRDEQVKEVMK